MKALVTGISGFVGSHLAEYLLSHTDWQVAGTVYGDESNIQAVCHQLELYPAELSKLSVVESVLDRARPDVIFHLAAMAATSRSWEDPAATLGINLAMQANVLQAVVNLDLDARIVVIGSSEEYGAVRPDQLPIDEDTPFRPMNPYAVSKVGQDMLGLQYYLSHKLDTVRVRPFNHIGPRQGLGFVASDFASQVARIEAGLQVPVMRVGNLQAERDFTDVRDVVRAYHLLAVHAEPGNVYNVGSGQSHSIQQVLDILLEQSRATIRVEQDPTRMRPSDVPRVVCDLGRIHECAGWEPQILFETSLCDVLDYWRAQVASKTKE